MSTYSPPRARQAWQEFQPISTAHVRNRGRSGFAEARIYRKIQRGPHLDVFCLDMRTWKGTNTAGTETHRTPHPRREAGRLAGP